MISVPGHFPKLFGPNGNQPGASTTLTLERGDTRHTITLPSESP